MSCFEVGVFCVTEIINGTKELLNKQYESGRAFCSGKPFSTYQKVYFSTNENIKDYININNLEGKNTALSVMASGDHSFNLVEKGVLNIDTFDSNALTEFYVLGIKRAMIMRYSYKEYLITLNKLLDINTSLVELTGILSDLLPFMDKKYREYWRYIIDYNYSIQKNKNSNINLFNLLFINIVSGDKLVERNGYLKDEETYNRFKDNLFKTNITFKNVNAINISNEFKGKYDIMLLSNIFEYLQSYFREKSGYYNMFKTMKEYIDDLGSIMNEEGKLFLMYIFHYATDSYTREKLFHSFNVTLKDFEDYELPYELLKVNSCASDKMKDGVLVLKK